MSLFDQKWQKFLRRIWLFKWIPFADFVLAAGSLATGSLREDSDFDVIVGVRQGRIFTARAFCILLFGLLGWRRKADKTNRTDRAADKVCFSHFVTPAAYRLSPPHNKYWQNLYLSLVPVYGEKVLIQKFWDANQDWTGPVRNRARACAPEGPLGRAISNGMRKGGQVAKFLEWLLSGNFGDWLEKKLKAIQIKRIEESLKSTETYKPRIIYNDNELEFHPHTKRIEDFLRNQS